MTSPITIEAIKRTVGRHYHVTTGEVAMTAQFQAAADANRRLHWSKKPKGERTIDRFAEALSETGSVAKSARATGISYEYGRTLLKRIRSKLGGQAR